ncbi:unnamed protein product [Diatraea saccharalis]|uniref:Uncharacterized protein n=1 Tax=Diatraea saccharalis TaxID=40085 RepID=A0A9N9WEX8_9NEOP|nr:unnamed protein product [Diatraea saccharalis]
MFTNTTNVEFDKNLSNNVTFDYKNVLKSSVKDENLIPDGIRRSFNKVAGDSVETQKAITPTDEHVLKDFTTSQLITKTINVTVKVTKIRSGTQFNFRSKNKHMNKDKMDRFKKFMSKNKNAFSDFLKKKQQTQAIMPKIAASPRPISRNQSISRVDATVGTSRTALETSTRDTTVRPLTSTTKSVIVQETTPFTWKTKKATIGAPTTPSSDSSSKESRPHMRAHILRANDDDVSINPEELDMAPARGRKVHIMRMKNRLCQRNVMLPEGPKYDSKGNMYLGAFTHKYGRDYSRTRPPVLVLPRCCNCCKKSVLGCE